MSNKKATKRALLTSILAICLCLVMLIGSTFAWFTDTASTNVNSIQSGTLKVALWQADVDKDLDAETPLKWVKAPEATGEKVLWEPGCKYNLESFRIHNDGNLALKYKVVISGIVGNAELLKAIDFTVTVDGTALEAKEGTSAVTTAADLNNFEGKLAAGATTGKITITGHMKEEAGNEYQDKSIDGITITVYATQDTVENDSYGNTYDAMAQYPVETISSVETKTDDAGNTVVKNAVVLESAATVKVSETETKPLATATVPADTKLKADTTSLKLVITETDEPDGFTVADGMSATTFDVKVIGVASDNTVVIPVEMYIDKGLSDVKLYHNGTLMGTDEFSYNAETGLLTFKTATFSPFTVEYYAPGVITADTIDAVNEAIANAREGDTIQLSGNVEGKVIMNGKKALTFDFNGNTVNGIIYIGCIDDGFTSAKEPSRVTFEDTKGNGGVTSTASFAVIAKNGSEITINGGNFVNEYAKSGSNGYSSVIKMTNCTLTVNDGYLHNDAQVGSYNRVIVVDNDGKNAKVTINGGKLEGTKENHATQWPAGNYSYIIASDTSGDTFDVEINNGEFISHTSQSYLTQVYGNVVVNNCTFVSEGHSQVFDIKNGATVTVKGGTYTIAEGENANLAGFAYCNKDTNNAYGYTKGALILDPVNTLKINTTTHKNILSDCGVTQSAKDANGYYTISK